MPRVRLLLLLGAAHDLTVWTGQCTFAIAAVLLWMNTPHPGPRIEGRFRRTDFYFGYGSRADEDLYGLTHVAEAGTAGTGPTHSNDERLHSRHQSLYLRCARVVPGG